MMTPQFFVTFLLLLLQSVNSAKAVFNLTSAHCVNPSEDFLVNMYSEWPAFSEDGSDGYCYDGQGVGYSFEESFLTCSGCMEFTCSSRPCEDRDGSLWKMFWTLESVVPECCQSCDGAIVPPNQLVTTAQLSDKCQVREVAVCKTAPEGSTEGSIEVSYESDYCCSDESGWSQLGKSKLEPEACSRRTCSTGSPAHWNTKIVYSGLCNCCVYDGLLVADGGSVQLANGEIGKCCKGEIGVSLETKDSATTVASVTTAVNTAKTIAATTTETTTNIRTTSTTTTKTAATTEKTATTATTSTTATTETTATTATAATTTTITTSTTTSTTSTTTTTTTTTTTSKTATKTATTTTAKKTTTNTKTTTTTITTTSLKTTTASTTTPITNKIRKTTIKTFIPTIQSGHTLLRKIVVNTTLCSRCSEGSLIIEVWGADDAMEVHNCTTEALKVTGVGKDGFEKELGEYTKTFGCHKAPLDASVSDGTIRWHGRGKWEANHVCFEWLDEKKFPLDCLIQGNKITYCKSNRKYQGLKCPTN